MAPCSLDSSVPARWLLKCVSAYQAMEGGIWRDAVNKMMRFVHITPLHRFGSLLCYILFAAFVLLVIFEIIQSN